MLQDISFEVASGERVGIVGRTGSGKARLLICRGIGYKLTTSQSSLTLALLRCILTQGNVIYDGLSTSALNLDALRSTITIIPQVVCLSRLPPTSPNTTPTHTFPAAGAPQRDAPPEPGPVLRTLRRRPQ